MRETMHKKVVQIGLDHKAELACLVFKEKEVREKWTRQIFRSLHIPDDMGCEFDYYGIDCNAGSIDFCARRYWDVEKATWICASIVADSSCRMFIDNRIPQQPSFMYWGYKNAVATLTLNELFTATGGVDLLVMDIEGHEHEIFRNYDFEFKPKYVYLSQHRHTEIAETNQTIIQAGYAIIHKSGSGEGSRFTYQLNG